MIRLIKHMELTIYLQKIEKAVGRQAKMSAAFTVRRRMNAASYRLISANMLFSSILQNSIWLYHILQYSVERRRYFFQFHVIYCQ